MAYHCILLAVPLKKVAGIKSWGLLKRQITVNPKKLNHA
jgi:hypothetical protein